VGDLLIGYESTVFWLDFTDFRRISQIEMALNEKDFRSFKNLVSLEIVLVLIL